LFGRENNWIPSKVVEDTCEQDALEFLKSKGINATSVKRREYPTPDYEWNNIGIEVTAVHFYDPPSHQELKEFLANNPGNYYVMYGYGDQRTNKPTWKTITKKTIESPYSIVYTRQNISFYRKKIINEIDTKYRQARDYKKEVIVLDFRTAPFRLSTLVTEIHDILTIIGEDHPSLAGIIIVAKEHDLSSIDKVRYVFLRNMQSQHFIKELDEELDFSKPQSTDLLDLIEIVARPGVLAQTPISIKASLLLDAAEEMEKEVRRQGLPL
jgi:hypothetical protein